MRSPILFALGCIGSLGLLVGCGEMPPSPESAVPETVGEETQSQPAPLNIVVSVLPQKYFVEKIGGDRVNVAVMVGKGIEPENYEPKPQQLKDLSNADAYIGLGILFEQVWSDRLKGGNKQMKWLDASQGVEKLPLADHHHGEEEGTDHSEEEELLDPHIWLSPKRVKQQAENIYQLLAQLDPANEAIYAQNLGLFLTEIEQLDQAIAEQLKPLKNRSFLIFHPSFGYLAKDYNLEQLTIEVEGQEPSAAELSQLMTKVKEKEIRVIFAQKQFSAKSAETIAKEVNAKVVMIDPLAENWSENLLEITNELVLANSPLP